MARHRKVGHLADPGLKDNLTLRPAVSVVLTTFNRATVLRDTVDTILQQSFSDFELIICDDASTDDTSQIVAEVCKSDPRVLYLSTPTRLGMPNNLNRGILRAQGDYIANLHDGDIYGTTLLERWRDALENCHNAGFVFNSVRDLGEWSAAAHVWSAGLNPCSDGRALLRLYDRRWRFNSPVWGTVMVRKTVYEELGVLDERFGFFADVDMWLRIAERYGVAYIDDALITLPTKVALPRQINLPVLKERRIIHNIFRASRRRRTKGPFAKLRHYSIHNLFVALDYVYTILFQMTGLNEHLFRTYSRFFSRASAIRENP